MRFARELDPTFAMFNVLTLYPGTALWEQAAGRGMVAGDEWRRFAEDSPGIAADRSRVERRSE